MPSKPLVILHGWSDSAESFRPLARFFEREGGRDVALIRLGDWLSLNDEVTYLDLATAMQEAWRSRRLPTSRRSVDVVVHSNGALVVRQWLTLLHAPDDNPVDHLLMLAPANYGSPLAHKGRAFYGRIIKGWRTGFQTGTWLLNGMELGSAYTFDLAEADVLSRSHWYGRNRIKATVLVGNTGYRGVRAAANEDGGDGTVRISGANLDARRMTADFSRSGEPVWRVDTPSSAHRTAFAILDGDNHGSIIMKDANEPRNDQARDLFLRAVSVTAGQWDGWCDELGRIRKRVEDQATHRRDSEHHLYQNTIVRVRDDVGNPVPDYFVEFYEHDSDTSALGRFFHRDVLRKVHRPAEDDHYRSMYVNATLLHHRIDKQDVDRLEIAISAEPRFDANARVGYALETGSVKLTPAEVRDLFRANETLLVDITIKREMRDVFRFVEVGPGDV